MPDSQFKITGAFSGAEQIIRKYRDIEKAIKGVEAAHKAAQKASRQPSQKASQREDQRVELQFLRDKEAWAKRAAAEAVMSARRIAHENQRVHAENIAGHRRYIQQLRSDQSRLQELNSKATRAALVGGAGLAATGGGLKVAANLEDAMTDLRISIMRTGKDGTADLAALNAQMAEFEALAIRLGNTLPGSTRTMTQLFRSMRECGMSAKQILGGAGEGAAFLAITSKEDPEALGKAYAQLLTMGQVKPEDQVKAADLLARINTISGYRPTELIEGAKYSIPRGGMPLGLKGFTGLSSNLQMLGLMKRYGLEGSVGGEGIANLMTRLTMDTKRAQKAGSSVGFKFFDRKGEFLGVENMITQFEKLKKLSTERRAEVLHDVFGERGKPAAAALSEIGLKGYQDYAAELASVASLQEKINLETGKFNTIMENIGGTAENAIGKTLALT
jgi:TP901 family phage tail tape measure protein